MKKEGKQLWSEAKEINVKSKRSLSKETGESCQTKGRCRRKKKARKELRSHLNNVGEASKFIELSLEGIESSSEIEGLESSSEIEGLESSSEIEGIESSSEIEVVSLMLRGRRIKLEGKIKSRRFIEILKLLEQPC